MTCCKCYTTSLPRCWLWFTCLPLEARPWLLTSRQYAYVTPVGVHTAPAERAAILQDACILAASRAKPQTDQRFQCKWRVVLRGAQHLANGLCNTNLETCFVCRSVVATQDGEVSPRFPKESMSITRKPDLVKSIIQPMSVPPSAQIELYEHYSYLPTLNCPALVGQASTVALCGRLFKILQKCACNSPFGIVSGLCTHFNRLSRIWTIAAIRLKVSYHRRRR